MIAQRSLTDLKKGESAIISAFLRKDFAAKLHTLGLKPNEIVEMVRYSPFGQSLYLKVNGQFIALRKEEANSIIIE